MIINVTSASETGRFSLTLTFGRADNAFVKHNLHEVVVVVGTVFNKNRPPHVLRAAHNVGFGLLHDFVDAVRQGGRDDGFLSEGAALALKGRPVEYVGESVDFQVIKGQQNSGRRRRALPDKNK